MKSNRSNIWQGLLLVLLPIQLFLNGFLFFFGSNSHPPADFAQHSERLYLSKEARAYQCHLPNRILQYRTTAYKLKIAQIQNHYKLNCLLRLQDHQPDYSEANQFLQSLSNPLLQISHPPLYSTETASDLFSGLI